MNIENELDETSLWNSAIDGMSVRGKHKLANLLPHKYLMESPQKAIILNRDDREAKGECLILLPDGRLFIAQITI